MDAETDRTVVEFRRSVENYNTFPRDNVAAFKEWLVYTMFTEPQSTARMTAAKLYGQAIGAFDAPEKPPKKLYQGQITPLKPDVDSGSTV